jgi:hypothetical protein
VFFDTKDDEEFYQNKASFYFNTLEAKQIIDSFLYNIRTES